MMNVWKILFSFVLFITCIARAQPIPPELQLPSWAKSEWLRLAESASLKLSTRINPFVLRGDFDADGQPDLALLVEQTQSGKAGIAILHRSDRKPVVLGAGRNFGNGGDDFEWLDIWNVQAKGKLKSVSKPKLLHLRGDALYLVKDGAASALVYYEGGSYKWLQLGD